jgi:hypothetical protein
LGGAVVVQEKRENTLSRMEDARKKNVGREAREGRIKYKM